MTGSERRQHTRVPVDWTARVLQNGRGIVSARVIDLCLGGCCLTAAERFPEGSETMMEICTADSEFSRKFLVGAKIMHTFAADGGFGHGVRFNRISDKDLWWLVEFLAQAKQHHGQ